MRSYATNIFWSAWNSAAKSIKTIDKELLAFEKAKDVFQQLYFKKISPSAAVDLEQFVLNYMAFQPHNLPTVLHVQLAWNSFPEATVQHTKLGLFSTHSDTFLFNGIIQPSDFHSRCIKDSVMSFNYRLRANLKASL